MKETLEEKRERAKKIISILKNEYPFAKTSLNFVNPLELLISTILSAQCTDERVNIVTEKLFKKYRSAKDYANADIKELEEDIRSTGFYRNKAKNIKKCCQDIVEKHNGAVPEAMDELIQLAGIGRKTANVVLGNAFGIQSGVVVDTHVLRISQLLKLTNQKTPEKIEIDLMELVPKKDWILFPHLIIAHGRKICIARRPRCGECKLNKLCPSAKLNNDLE